MPDTFRRLTAALDDRYAIERELGSGGMATVYLADDRKHKRKVAVKVLRPELAAILGAERFLKEIEVTANLQHPHILPLFDSGVADSFLYYVMPFVEGESLRDKLNRDKQLAIEETLAIAKAVAGALDHAHRHDIIHRDIKPENILLQDGEAVVGDFGIALAVNAAGGQRLTETGLSLGTPEYMSPEQATGDRELDARSDVYSLAAVVYEMLTGDAPFQGNTTQAIISKLLTTTPASPNAIRASVPAAVDRAVMRALAKTPVDRFASAGSFAAALASEDSLGIRVVTRLGWRTAAVAAAVVGAIAAVVVFGGDDAIPVVGRIDQVTRDAGLEVDPSLSPDGAMLAYAAGHPTRMQIFVRQVGGGRVIALTDDSTRNHRWPRWSPDGTRIAYQTDEGIDVVPALGGSARSVVRLAGVAAESTTTAFSRLSGLAWSPDGRRIAYTRSIEGGGVTIAPLDGDEPVHLATVSGAHSPAWSPDGTQLAVVSDNPIFVFGGAYFGNEGASSIWIVSPGGEPPVQVTDDAYLNMSPQWSPDGRHLFWISDRGGARDIYRVRVGRAGRMDGDRVRITTGADAHTISLAADGTRLAFASFRTHSNIWSLPVPATGPVSAAAAQPVTSGVQTVEGLDVTADGSRLVFDSDRSGNFEIYTLPASGGEPVQVTDDPAGDYSPAWSPDGQRIAFHSLRHGTRDVFVMNADGSELARVTRGSEQELDVDWSPDGQALVYEELNWDMSMGYFSIVPLGAGELRTLDVGGDFASWSPSGDLIAFHTFDGVRVVSPRTGESRLVAGITEEYGEPLYAEWAPDGRTLYYVAKSTRSSTIHAVPAAGGRSRLVVRFDDPARQHTRYGFATDGQTFYFTMGSHESDIWVAELERR